MAERRSAQRGISVEFDMLRDVVVQPHGVFANKLARQIGVTLFERTNDVRVIFDRPAGTIAFEDRQRRSTFSSRHA